MRPEFVTSGCHVDEQERKELYQRLLVLLGTYVVESGRVVDAFAAAQQVHRSDFLALMVITGTRRAAGPVTPKTLIEALNLTSGAVTGVVDRLVRTGHVERLTDSLDRRQVNTFTGPLPWRFSSGFSSHWRTPWARCWTVTATKNCSPSKGSSPTPPMPWPGVPAPGSCPSAHN